MLSYLLCENKEKIIATHLFLWKQLKSKEVVQERFHNLQMPKGSYDSWFFTLTFKGTTESSV